MNELLHVPVSYWVSLGVILLAGGVIGGIRMSRRRGQERRSGGLVPEQFRHFSRDGL